MKISKKKGSPSDKKKSKILREETLLNSNMLNKARKVAFKKMKKERKRAGKVTLKISLVLHKNTISFFRIALIAFISTL